MFVISSHFWDKYSTFVNFRNIDCYFNFPPDNILYPSP